MFMSKPARGTKRVCQSCGARFYDLGRSPIVCPLCQAVYQVAPPATRRAERPAPVEVVRPKPVEPEIEPATLEGPETISLEDVDEAVDEAVIEAEIADLGEDEAEIPAAGEDDTFLEEPEGDEEPDVKGIVGGGEGEES
jgi:uncharacterized protein (TIGR02300 family)